MINKHYYKQRQNQIKIKLKSEYLIYFFSVISSHRNTRYSPVVGNPGGGLYVRLGS